MVMLLWCRRIMPGLLDSVMGSWGLVEGIGDCETLSANVSIPKSARPPRVVVVGLVWGLDWGRCG